MNRISKLFQPSLIIPKNAQIKNLDITSKSHKLMLEMGLIRHCGNGTYYLLPLLQRSIEKCVDLIDFYMKEIGCQKMSLPILTASELWIKSGRFETAKSELMVTTDRHNKIHILSPTHEESITSLLSTISPISYRAFPLRLYQTNTKFRDEMKPRFGIIRAKEFLMKDLYSFDLNSKAARQTYDLVNEQYSKIFGALKIPFAKVSGDSGVMGGKVSHEYHFLTSIGEDQIVDCPACSKMVNKEVCIENGKICNKCTQEELIKHNGIEVGHTFILEDKYTKMLKATYLNKAGKPEFLQMGCYGIGVTRMIAASIEYLSNEELRWPYILAPYKVCIIGPKEGSKEEATTKHFVDKLYQALDQNKLSDSIIVDDRRQLTIGKRIMEAKKFGYPLIIVVGGKAAEEDPMFELHKINENVVIDLRFNEILNHLENYA